VKTPTLVIVGDSDGECPTPQSYEFWHALKTLGVEAQSSSTSTKANHFAKPADQRDRARLTAMVRRPSFAEPARIFDVVSGASRFRVVSVPVPTESAIRLLGSCHGPFGRLPRRRMASSYRCWLFLQRSRGRLGNNARGPENSFEKDVLRVLLRLRRGVLQRRPLLFVRILSGLHAEKCWMA